MYSQHSPLENAWQLLTYYWVSYIKLNFQHVTPTEVSSQTQQVFHFLRFYRNQLSIYIFQNHPSNKQLLATFSKSKLSWICLCHCFTIIVVDQHSFVSSPPNELIFSNALVKGNGKSFLISMALIIYYALSIGSCSNDNLENYQFFKTLHYSAVIFDDSFLIHK